MKKSKFHIDTSKLLVYFAFALACGFVIFCCFEMHRLQDLTPVAYLGAGMLVLLGFVVKSYMVRAAAKDMSQIKMIETAELSKLRKKYGDNYQEGNVNPPDLTVQ